MINYFRHIQIDKDRWDNCISKSLNRRVYAFSWYLDLVSPGWEALVEDDYKCVFPLTCRRKWATSYLAQPYFAQQLGIFSPEIIQETHVSDFIRAIPKKFRFAEIHLNATNRNISDSWHSVMRINHEAGLSASYEELSGKYAQNTKRNIRKALESGITLSHATGVDELIALFRENFGQKEGKLKAVQYETLRRLILHCIDRKAGYIIGAMSKEGELSAGAFFLFDQARVYFLFAASAPAARENGAMFFLIDRFISENAGKPLVLDFEGGNEQNLGRFYKSFGAIEVLYPALRINRLSKVAQSALYFVRKLRK